MALTGLGLTQLPRLIVTDVVAPVNVTQAPRLLIADSFAPVNVTQAVRLVVQAPFELRHTQQPRLLITDYPVSSGFGLRIDNIERTSETRAVGSLHIGYQLGARGTASFEILDRDSFETAYRPQIDQRVDIYDGQTLLFHGRILGVTDHPLGAPGVGTVTQVEAVDDWVAAAMRRVSKTYAAGATLKSVVTDLVSTYLSVYGILLDLMGAGPTLPALTFDGVTIEEAFNQLVDLSGGWVYRLLPSSVVQWFPVGSKARTFTLSAAHQNIIGPISWTKSRGQYTNRIVLRYGTGLVGKQQLWHGDGATLRFRPDYPPTFPAPATNGWIGWMNYVGGPYPGPIVPTVPPSYGGHEAIGISAANNFPWWWDAAAGELVRNVGAPIPFHPPENGIAAAPDADDYFWIDYNVQFPLTVTAELPEALIFPIESVLDRTDIFDTAQAQAYADSLLVKFGGSPRTVTLKTRAATNLLPGEVVPLDVPSRTLPNAEWLITEVALVVEVDQKWMVTLTLLEGATAQASWLDFWRDIAGKGASSGGGASGSLIPPPAGGGAGASGTVSNATPLTLHALAVGEGDVNLGVLPSLGSVAAVLHGNATGDPTWRPIDQIDMGGPATDGKVLTADWTVVATGMAWKTPAAGGGGGTGTPTFAFFMGGS